MDDLATKKEILNAAEKVLAVLETQAAGHTNLTIPAYLQVQLEDKQKEVENLRSEIADLEKQKISHIAPPANVNVIEKSTILSFEDAQSMVDLLVASQLATTPRLRRDLLLKIGNNPEEYQLSGVSSSNFAKSLIYRLNGIAKPDIFIRLLHEIVNHLPSSLNERILSIQSKLETPIDKRESDQSSSSPYVPSVDEIVIYIETIPEKRLPEHIQLLDGVGYYFRKTKPTDLGDKYIETVEKLLNELEYRAFESRWTLELQDMLLEALCLSGELAGIVKRHPGVSRSKKFIRTARGLGRVLNRVHWRGPA